MTQLWSWWLWSDPAGLTLSPESSAESNPAGVSDQWDLVLNQSLSSCEAESTKSVFNVFNLHSFLPQRRNATIELCFVLKVEIYNTQNALHHSGPINSPADGWCTATWAGLGFVSEFEKAFSHRVATLLPQWRFTNSQPLFVQTGPSSFWAVVETLPVVVLKPHSLNHCLLCSSLSCVCSVCWVLDR